MFQVLVELLVTFFPALEFRAPRGLTLREGDIASSHIRSAITCANNACLWPKAMDGFVYVPFILSPLYGRNPQIKTGLANQVEIPVFLFNSRFSFPFFFCIAEDMDRITIETGMQEISASTCIKFIPRTHEANFLDIQPRYGWVIVAFKACFENSLCDICGVILHCNYDLCLSSSCWSFLGQTGGSQTLSLQSPGCMWSGVAAHEFMHALGFVHEQSRSDRDRYVSIVWKNIMPGRGYWHFLGAFLYTCRHSCHPLNLFFLHIYLFNRPNAQLQETADEQPQQPIWLRLCHALWKVSCTLRW